MHMHTHDIIGNSQGFPQWGLPFGIEIIMFNVYMCMHAHVHACVWWAPPTEPKTPIFNKF